MSVRVSLAFLLAAAGAAPAAEPWVAVLVGVNQYDDAKLDDLRFAENDATELRDVLKAAGYGTRLYTTAEGKKDAQFAPTTGLLRGRTSVIEKV